MYNYYGWFKILLTTLLLQKFKTKQEFDILQRQGSAIWMCAKPTLGDAEKSILHN